MSIDEMLCTAAADASKTMVESFELDYNPEQQHEFSSKFEQKIRKLKRRADHPWLYRSIRCAASILLAMLIGGGAWLTVDAEAREAFFSWIKEPYSIFFVYRFPGETDAVPEDSGYRPTWLPDGYTEQEVFEGEGSVTLIYRNEVRRQIRFGYMYNPDGNTWYFDVSNTIYSESSVNGQPADFFLSTAERTASTLVWTLDEPPMAFEVTGFLSESELIQIAESVSAEK